jgi:choline kinase
VDVSDAKQQVVVILAAGVGSRMGEITTTTNKCIIDLDHTTSIKHILKSFHAIGVKSAIIVVGHFADKIEAYLHEEQLEMNIIFVYNEYFDYHGCGYSLALAATKRWDEYETIYITEADLLLPQEYIEAIVKNKSDNAVIVRDKTFIDKTRSVVAIGDKEDKIKKFVYDGKHDNIYKCIEANDIIIGESMQLWKVSGEAKRVFYKMLKHYREETLALDKKDESSNLICINKLIKDYYMVPINIAGDKWLNLNTMNDIELGRSTQWLIRQ